MSLKGLNIVTTGASRSIGAAIARGCVQRAANVLLLARDEARLNDLKSELSSTAEANATKIECISVDLQSTAAVQSAIRNGSEKLGQINVLINNAGLALGAPARFHELKLDDIDTMIGTNVSGMMYVTHAVLNEGGMAASKQGVILNVTSVTGLEVPPFPGEAIYHSTKAYQEAFTNVLRTELQDTNIKVVALRPGVVATHFHEQRVGYDKQQYDDFMAGFEPLVSQDVAEAAMYMLEQKERISVKALDIVPTAQRTLQVFDKKWDERQAKLDNKPQ